MLQLTLAVASVFTQLHVMAHNQLKAAVEACSLTKEVGKVKKSAGAIYVYQGQQLVSKAAFIGYNGPQGEYKGITQADHEQVIYNVKSEVYRYLDGEKNTVSAEESRLSNHSRYITQLVKLRPLLQMTDVQKLYLRNMFHEKPCAVVRVYCKQWPVADLYFDLKTNRLLGTRYLSPNLDNTMTVITEVFSEYTSTDGIVTSRLTNRYHGDVKNRVVIDTLTVEYLDKEKAKEIFKLPDEKDAEKKE